MKSEKNLDSNPIVGEDGIRIYRFCSLVEDKRVDRFLSALFPTVSRTFFQKVIEEGGRVFCNEAPVDNKTPVHVGDVFAVSFPKLKEFSLVPEDIPLSVIYEDKWLIAINKPPGMVVHPTERGGHYSGTVVNALLHYLNKEALTDAKEFRPGLVHRIDKDTSGVLLLAKNDDILGQLAKKFQAREVYKEYLALVRGHMAEDTGMINSPIGRHSIERKKMAIAADEGVGREALTEFFVEERYRNSTLLRVRIHTGRTHQIRVHMASIGHPVMGDITYGDKKLNKKFIHEFGLTRQFLHASKLRIEHPVKREPLELTAPLPEDLTRVVEKLRSLV